MDIDKLILKFIWRGKRPRIANTILKKNNVDRLTLPNSKIYYKAIGNQDDVVLVKEQIKRSMGQNRESRNRPI